jgi:hypothetical protein
MNLSTKLALGLLASLAITGQAYADGVSVQFKNGSKWTIDHIYLADSGGDDWGPDQLGDEDGDTVAPGASFTLSKITPSKYDLKLIDEDGDECVVSGLKLGADQVVEINDQNLLNCQGATAAQEEEE